MGRAKVRIGMKDERGSLLLLGGHQANLWQLKNGLYAVVAETTADAEEAMRLYNVYNETKMPLDYVREQFEPWYAKQNKIVANVPSKSDPDKSYTIKPNPSGELTCECLGFMFRGTCWHIEATKELMKNGIP